MIKKQRRIKLTPPKMSFCIAMILFAVMMASLMTYFSIDLAKSYEKVKNILQTGQLVECEFKEVGRQFYAQGYTYGDGYDYYAIYEYIDENGNRYKAESTREFKSTKEVMKYVESHPTKALYIDGNGYSISADETISKHTAKIVIIVMVAVGFYAVIAGFAIQLIRRISMNIKNKETRPNENACE